MCHAATPMCHAAAPEALFKKNYLNEDFLDSYYLLEIEVVARHVNMIYGLKASNNSFR